MTTPADCAALVQKHPGAWRGMLQALVFVPAVSLSIAACVSCSLNGMGFVVSDVTNTSTATVTRVRALGAQLRTRPDSSGATIGYTDYVYIFPLSSEIASGRYWLTAPMPQTAQSVAVAGMSVGVDVMTQPPEFALSLGAAQHVLLAQVPADANLMRSVVFDIDRPELTVVKEYKGCLPC